MDKGNRITRLSIETERTYVFRSRDDVQRRWCAACEAEVEMATIAGASSLLGLSEIVIYRLVESGALHFMEDDEGRVLVCPKSLYQPHQGR